MVMYHHASMAAVEVEWTLVSVKRPCAICRGHDGCRWGFDGEFACCIRVSSEWPLSAGGWVHRVKHSSRATSLGQGDPSVGAWANAALGMNLL
jgi:hypothetical protein